MNRTANTSERSPAESTAGARALGSSVPRASTRVRPSERTRVHAAERTRVRPTMRGAVLTVLALALWTLGDVTALVVPRALAAALLLALVTAVVSVALAAIRLHLRRRVLDAAVPVGGRVRVELLLDRASVFGRIPLGRGAVREHLPAQLGGAGDLGLTRVMSHTLPVSGLGELALGPVDIHLRDALGLLHLRRRILDDAVVIGLPVVEEIPAPVLEEALRATLAARTRAGADTMATRGSGELGPQARVYASGDDIRRIHWRATARTGRLMTREEEPMRTRSAVILLDVGVGRGIGADRADAAGRADAAERVTAGRPDSVERSAALERSVHERAVGLERAAAVERAVDHAASLLAALARAGWETDVVGPAGARITGLAPGAALDLDQLIALAVAGGATRAERTQAMRPANSPSLVVAIGAGGGADAELEAERLDVLRADALGAAGANPRGAGIAHAQGRGATAILLDATSPRSEHAGAWTLLRGPADAALTDVLTAAPIAPESAAPSAPARAAAAAAPSAAVRAAAAAATSAPESEARR